MKPETAILATLFAVSDVGWVFEQATSEEGPDQVAERIRAHMSKVNQEMAKAFPLRPHLLVEESIRTDSSQFKALIQAFASPVTAPMCAMIYAVLDGAEVTAIEFSYKARESVSLSLTVQYETGEAATFLSDDAWDVEVLRHFGIMKLGNKPVIDGYYAFRKAAD